MLSASLESQGLTKADIITKMSLIGRLSESIEIAHGTLFLSSDDARFIHGTVLHVED